MSEDKFGTTLCTVTNSESVAEWQLLAEYGEEEVKEANESEKIHTLRARVERCKKEHRDSDHQIRNE